MRTSREQANHWLEHTPEGVILLNPTDTTFTSIAAMKDAIHGLFGLSDSHQVLQSIAEIRDGAQSANDFQRSVMELLDEMATYCHSADQWKLCKDVAKAAYCEVQPRHVRSACAGIIAFGTQPMNEKWQLVQSIARMEGITLDEAADAYYGLAFGDLAAHMTETDDIVEFRSTSHFSPTDERFSATISTTEDADARDILHLVESTMTAGQLMGIASITGSDCRNVVGSRLSTVLPLTSENQQIDDGITVSTGDHPEIASRIQSVLRSAGISHHIESVTPGDYSRTHWSPS